MNPKPVIWSRSAILSTLLAQNQLSHWKSQTRL